LKISSCECRAAVTQLNISVMSCEEFVISAQKVWYFCVSYTYCTTHPHTSTYQLTTNSLYLPTSDYLHSLPTYQ
jgi:hypothetical protein